MKNNIYAIYNNCQYECEVQSSNEIILFSKKPVDGFKLSFVKYTKVVSKNECDRVWKQELFFKYMDDTFRVWSIKGDKLYLRADRDTFDAQKYGFEVCEIEKYGHKIYGKWVNETDGEKEWHITEY